MDFLLENNKEGQHKIKSKILVQEHIRLKYNTEIHLTILLEQVSEKKDRIQLLVLVAMIRKNNLFR